MKPSKRFPAMVACITFMLATWIFSMPRDPVQARADSPITPSSLWTSTLTDTKLLGLQDLFWKDNITGRNSTIAFLDTGINAGHEVFAGKTVYWKDVTNESYSTPRDIVQGSHGTLCASLATGNSSSYKGVTPGADVLAVKMFYDDKGSPNAGNPDAEAAIDYTLANANTMHVRVASCSWGDDNSSSNGNDELSVAVERLVDAGIVTIVAAGNVEGKVTHVAAPGAARKVITVGSFDPDTFQVPSFSLPGPTGDGRIKPDIIAPGVKVIGAASISNTTYVTSQGTSFSTPIVSGIANLLVEKYPTLDPYQLKNVLCLTALSCYDSGSYPDNSEGWGIVNPAGVVKVMDNTWNGTSPLTISIAMNASWTRSYFTKVHLEAGVTEEITISPVAANTISTIDALNYFQASVFDSTGDAYGVPKMIARDNGGKILLAAASTGDYILAIKPLPAAWTAASGNFAVQFKVELVHTYVIQVSWIAGIIFLASGNVLVFAMTLFMLHEKKKNLGIVSRF
jgi:hypothetical protein